MKKLIYSLVAIFSAAMAYAVIAPQTYTPSPETEEVEAVEVEAVEVSDTLYTEFEIVDSLPEDWDYEEEELGYSLPCLTCSADYYDSIGQPFPLHDYLEVLERKDYATLALKADSVLDVIPGDPLAMYMSAYANMMQGNTVEGILAGTSLLSSYPLDYGTQEMVHYMAMQRPDLTIPLLEQLAEARNNMGKYTPLEQEFIHQFIARLWRDAGYPDRALEIIREYEAVGTSWNGWPELKASAVADKGDIENALLIFSTVDEQNRDESWTEAYAIFLRNARGLEASNQFLEQAIDEMPYYYPLKDTYALNHALLGNYDRAIDIYTKLLAKDETDKTYYHLRRGMVYSVAGKKIEAGQEFSIVLSDPEASETLVTVAKAYSHIGNPDDYITEEMTELRPSFYAGIYNVYGNQEKALELLGRAYETYDWRPVATQYDLNLRSLLKHPDYPKALARLPNKVE